ncbi:GDP-mannose 4,6-dehydratase [Candidatus Microgenomates bacterium]|nr:GDP-mannose 4,6-dehydratase [Candidatus Microgenomates bacterium]
MVSTTSVNCLDEKGSPLVVDQKVPIGNTTQAVDWSHAKDMVRGMFLMLQRAPDDFILASGKLHTIAQLCQIAFSAVGLDWKNHIKLDPALGGTPNSPLPLVGDNSKAQELLGWKPQISFESTVTEMVRFNVQALKRV